MGEEHFTDPVNARAAVWLHTHLDAPTAGLPEADDELDRLVHRLADNARRAESKMPTLEAERLQLEIHLNRRRRAEAQTGEERRTLDRELVALRERLDEWIDRSLA